jgi:Ca2+/Na+ antiporter
VTFLNFLLVAALGCYVLVVLFFIYKYVQLRKDIEQALKEADQEEQATIRKMVVRAMFPPRFPRA